jgi:hypothetical protein
MEIPTHSLSSVTPCCVLQRKIYRGPIDVARHVISAEAGVRGLFKGLTATLGREIPGNIAMFGVYELLKQQFAQRQGLASAADLGKGSLLMAGGCAGTSFWLACYPMDIIKSKLQVGGDRTGGYACRCWRRAAQQDVVIGRLWSA